jgi:capsular exopolysaccharide synthesis family protein
VVERLKDAIEKASRERRRALAASPAPAPASGEASAPAPVPAPAPAPVPETLPETAPPSWAAIEAVTLVPRRLQRSRVITLDRTDPAHVGFDVLRSRLLKVFRDNGWKRLAITSPTKGCGKTFVAVNLALSLARQPDLRTLLIDMDLRLPQVAATLGLRDRRALADFLSGRLAPDKHLCRLGDNLALALNTERVRDAAELILDRRTVERLSAAIAALAPDIVIHDLPPMLVNDDAFAFLPQVDAVLLVAAAGQTRADQIDAAEKLIQGNAAFLGVVLNKVADGSDDPYGYGYGYGYG